MRHIDVYSFLTRAGLASKYHGFADNGISTVGALLELGTKGSARDVAKKLKDDFELGAVEAADFADILMKTTNERGVPVSVSVYVYVYVYVCLCE